MPWHFEITVIQFDRHRTVRKDFPTLAQNLQHVVRPHATQVGIRHRGGQVNPIELNFLES